MKVNFKPSARQVEEIKLYNLADEYHEAVAVELAAAERRKQKYGYLINRDTGTKNMIKALRMCPCQNTPVEWARLHVTESLMRVR